MLFLLRRKHPIKFLHLSKKVLLTPPDEGPRVKGQRIKLQDIVDGVYMPQRANGSWIDGEHQYPPLPIPVPSLTQLLINLPLFLYPFAAEEFLYQDHLGRICLLNAANRTERVLMSNMTFVSTSYLLTLTLSSRSSILPWNWLLIAYLRAEQIFAACYLRFSRRWQAVGGRA